MFIISMLAFNSHAAPQAVLWGKWSKNNPNNDKIIDHCDWDAFLRKYVITDQKANINLVKYSSVTKSDVQKLENYLKAMQKIDISNYNRKVQFAYWVNLYNALTVKLILDNYPVSSITKIKSGWFSFGPWNKKIATVESERITMNDIEHRILRPIWKDNRVHYALNCASISCPNLQTRAFTAKNRDKLLNAAVDAYINSPRAISFKNGDLFLSSIYDWYYSDFAKDEKHLIKYLAEHAKKDIAAKLIHFKGNIRYDYNWNLNKLK
ncbi:MAG: DUF547 domain-containing protein [Lentisphaerae bacterium]|nr:DUF547 domain-containing protein [Lentisphaerota bacterium]MCP4102114.1 DUF547 domain-containing protein [Lentisphaerota bacterium]